MRIAPLCLHQRLRTHSNGKLVFYGAKGPHQALGIWLGMRGASGLRH